MRTVTIGLVALGTAGVFACGGGGGAPVTPKTAEPAADAAGAAADTGDGGLTTTTTLMLSDAGELQGTKLQSSGSLTMQASADAGASPSGAGAASGEAGRRPDDIATIIKTHRDEFRACYDAALKDHPKLKGNIDLEWVMDPKGNVSRAGLVEAKSDIKEPVVVDCMVKALKAIKWAPSAKGFETKAHYPFNFNPGGAPKKP